MYYLERTLLGILFLIAILFVNSCHDSEADTINTMEVRLHPIAFDREEELSQLLSDLKIEISDQTVLFMPPTHCEMCIKKASVGVDSLVLNGSEIRLIFAQSNHSVCDDLDLNDNSSCHFYQDELIESKYGFYYWDPIVFSFKKGTLVSYEVL